MAQPAHQNPSGLRSSVHGLADLLLVRPLPARALLHARALEALREAAEADLDGLLPLLLRNLLRDLSGRGELDARYYANQLTLAADRLGL